MKRKRKITQSASKTIANECVKQTDTAMEASQHCVSIYRNVNPNSLSEGYINYLRIELEMEIIYNLMEANKNRFRD